MPWLEEWKSYRLRNDGKLQDRQAIPGASYGECRRRVRDYPSAFLEDWLKVLAWASICQRSGRMTTPDLATVV